MSTVAADTSENEVVSRIYEVGYHVIPSVAEENLEKVVGGIRATIEKAGGSFIAEGAPTLTKLAYPMEAREGDRRVSHDRGYFGWVKFEAPVAIADMLEEALKADANILRSIVFRTVREETRARMKAPTLREVKRTDTIKSSPRRPEEESAPISEVDLDKALQDITTD
ncbi:MAG: 30S ribosomal protein S6 [Parcubacteria group bacterium]|nr:30S ribosomal protein S6 [Parcubacteria group bacterium]